MSQHCQGSPRLEGQWDTHLCHRALRKTFVYEVKVLSKSESAIIFMRLWLGGQLQTDLPSSQPAKLKSSKLIFADACGLLSSLTWSRSCGPGFLRRCLPGDSMCQLGTSTPPWLLGRCCSWSPGWVCPLGWRVNDLHPDN